MVIIKRSLLLRKTLKSEAECFNEMFSFHPKKSSTFRSNEDLHPPTTCIHAMHNTIQKAYMS